MTLQETLNFLGYLDIEFTPYPDAKDILMYQDPDRELLILLNKDDLNKDFNDFQIEVENTHLYPGYKAFHILRDEPLNLNY